MRLRHGKFYDDAEIETPVREYAHGSQYYKRSSVSETQSHSRRLLNSSLSSAASAAATTYNKNKSVQYENTTYDGTTEIRNFNVKKESFRYSHGYQQINGRRMAAGINNNRKDGYPYQSLLKKSREAILTSTPLQKEKKHVSFIDHMSLKMEEKEPVNTEVDFVKLTSSPGFDQQSSKNSHYSKVESFKDNSTGCVNTLESFVFHDISYSNIGTVCSDDNYLHINNFSKLDGSFSQHFDDDDMNLNTSLSINHINRSRFRQIRREWYLNRRDFSHWSTRRSLVFYFFHSYFVLKVISFISSIVNKCRSIQRHCCLKRKMGYNSTSFYLRKILLSTAIVVQTFINCISTLFTYVAYHSAHSGRKVKRFILHNFKQLWATSYSNSVRYIFYEQEKTSGSTAALSDVNLTEVSHHKDDDDEPLFLCWSCVLFTFGLICFLPILFVLTFFIADKLLILPLPKELGIQNAYAFILDDASASIPLYHIRPPLLKSLPINKSFEYDLPIMLYMPKTEEINSTHQIQVYEVLSSLAYHVLVPYHPLIQSDIHVIWKWIKTKAPTSKVYMWGDHIDSRIIAGHAKSLCEKLFPPSGCIIATEAYYTGKQFRNLEVWSCSCSTILDERNSVLTYNNVKCPLTSTFSNDDLYYEIVSCVEALAKK